MSAAELLYFHERGAGPPLLLVHGVMVSGAMFDAVVDPLAARHRVIVPDLRGHGRSRTLPPPFDAATLAADLARLLDHLGVRSTAVVGYSQGGAIAQALVLDHPARCHRLVLACTYAFNLATVREKLEGHAAPLLLRALGMRRFAKLVFAVGLEGASADRKAWLTRLMGEQDRDAMLRAWREVMAFDSRPRLAEIRCPTLVLAGASDTAVPFHHARMLHDGIAGSRLEVIEGANHGLIWTHTAEFLKAVDAFLDAPGDASRSHSQ